MPRYNQASQSRKPLTSLSPNARLRQRGIGPSTLGHIAKTIVPKAKPRNDRQQKRWEQIQRRFASFAAGIEGLKVGNASCLTFEHAASPALPPWTKAHLRPFILFYAVATRSKGKRVGRIARRTVEVFLYSVASNYRRVKGVAIDPLVMKDGLAYIASLAKQLQLPMSTKPRAELTKVSIIAMSEAILAADFIASRRARLNIALYLAIAISGGTRSCSMLKSPIQQTVEVANLIPHNGENERVATGKASRSFRYPGIQWRHFEFVITRTGPIVHMASQDRKSGSSTGQILPMGTGPSTILSARYLLLIAGCMDGIFGDLTANDILDPQFLRRSIERRLIVDPQKGELFVLRNKNGSPCTVATVNRWLRQLSRVYGFELDVTTHCFRHLVAQVITMDGGTEMARLQLGHADGTSALKTYLGHGALTATKHSMTTTDATRRSIVKAVRPSAVPDPNCPRELSVEEEQSCLADSEVMALDDALRSLVKDPSQPTNAVKNAKALRDRKLQNVLRDRLNEIRADYFAKKRQGLFVPAALRNEIGKGSAPGAMKANQIPNVTMSEIIDLHKDAANSAGEATCLVKYKPTTTFMDDLAAVRQWLAAPPAHIAGKIDTDFWTRSPVSWQRDYKRESDNDEVDIEKEEEEEDEEEEDEEEEDEEEEDEDGEDGEEEGMVGSNEPETAEDIDGVFAEESESEGEADV